MKSKITMTARRQINAYATAVARKFRPERIILFGFTVIGGVG